MTEDRGLNRRCKNVTPPPTAEEQTYSDAQERHATLEEHHHRSRTRMAASRERQRSLGTGAKAGAPPCKPRADELQRTEAATIPKCKRRKSASKALADGNLTATIIASLQEACAQTRAAARRPAQYDSLTRPPAMSAAWLLSASSSPCAHAGATKEPPTGVERVRRSLAEAQTDEAALAASIAEGVRLNGLQSEIILSSDMAAGSMIRLAKP